MLCTCTSVRISHGVASNTQVIGRSPLIDFELEQKSKVEPAITFVHDVDRVCHFELENISKVDPKITFFNEFDLVCHFDLENISKVDPAITCFHDCY